MREIKYRGKDISSGEWLIGSHINDGGEEYIIPQNIFSVESYFHYQVDPNTVGEYIGLKDKDGKEIYEGDILRHGMGSYYVVEWHPKAAGFYCAKVGADNSLFFQYLVLDMSVVGNVYDNPELIEAPAEDRQEKDGDVLLPGEFRIKGLFQNGDACQPDVIYVARWLTKLDGPGKKGKIRIWSAGSSVKDGQRYGTYSDWDRSVLTNYEAVTEIEKH